MGEVFQFDDPVSRAVRYLNGFGLWDVEREEPDGYTYDGVLVLIHDGGGAGEYSRQLSDTRLTFDVRAGPERQRDAAEAASLVDALVRDWSYREGGVYYRGALSRPTFSPEADRRLPAYVWTVNLAFRGRPLSM